MKKYIDIISLNLTALILGVIADFQLPAGETRIEVTNNSSGIVVIADAIRWRPGVR